ncbi:MAG: hypothetical protein K6A89_04305 [Treponema sp.]|nr:hypothetical protein [Treponema sp.]
MKKIILIFTMMISAFSIFANDSVITYGSEQVSVDYSENDIRIVKENLDIFLYEYFYKVCVEYEYFNKGAKKIIQLGFPIKYASTAGMDEKNTYINEFEFSQIFNGKNIPVKNTFDDLQKNENYTIEGVYWINREVEFSEGRNVSKIEYTAPYSRSGFFFRFEYIISSAACWNNNIDVLNIKIHNDNKVVISKDWQIGQYNISNFPENYYFSGTSFEFSFADVNPTDFDSVHFSVESFALGDNPDFYFDFANGWFWDHIYFYKNESDVVLWTKEQLQMFIDSFAKHHFVLNKIERENRNYLKKLMKRFYE